MIKGFNRFFDWFSNFFAHRKGLLLIIGIGLVVINLIVQFIPGVERLAQTNLFLHLGIIFGLAGVMLAWAL